MKLLLALLFFACLSLSGCAHPSTDAALLVNPDATTNSSPFANVITQATDTTIAAKFSTSNSATPSMACGLSRGTYNLIAKDSGVDADSSLNHVQIVAGNLTPSTTYYCQISATNAGGTEQSTFTISTTATPATTTPITSITLGSVTAYNSINPNNIGSGDTFYNCKSDDGVTYMVSNDNQGFLINGQPTPSNAFMSLMRVLNESPMTIQTFQRFANYESPSGGKLADGLGSKAFGLFCMDGKIFLSYGRQDQSQKTAAHSDSYGNILMSEDHGASFDNPQNPTVFATTPPNPLSSSMWPGSPATMANMAFVKYGPDDGTLGYFDTRNQHDNGNAFAYTVFNEGVWNGGGTGPGTGGNVFYLARVPRAKLQNLNGSDWQWYTGGDGNQDSSWSSLESAAQPMLSNPGKLGTPDVVYIPALNRYVLLTFFYPVGAWTGGNVLDCEWLIYESPHPWGPWTQVFSQEFSGPNGGAYNPIILSDTAFSGTTPTIMWTGNYATFTGYAMYFATITLNH